MSELFVKISFSNGEHLRLNGEATIYVYNGDNEDIEHPYSSGGRFYTLGDYEHRDAGYAPFLMGMLTGNDFFSIGTDYDIEKVFYQSSSVVSIDHFYIE